MSGIASVYAVFADEEEAGRIARTLVDERLAACVNILGPCHSIYRWQGKVEEADEVAAIFKTRAGMAAKLVARIAEMHSYDVPCAVVWSAEASTAYSAWVEAETEL